MSDDPRDPPHPNSLHGRTTRPTVYICFRLGCEETPQWTLTPSGRGSVRVCDLHLGPILRACGLPARVDAWEPPDEPTRRRRIPTP